MAGGAKVVFSESDINCVKVDDITPILRRISKKPRISREKTLGFLAQYTGHVVIPALLVQMNRSITRA